MTKQEAYQAMKQGNRITHRHFSNDEFIFILNHEMFTEEGYRFEEGWNMRTGGNWEEDWSIYKPFDNKIENNYSKLVSSMRNKNVENWLNRTNL